MGIFVKFSCICLKHVVAHHLSMNGPLFFDLLSDQYICNIMSYISGSTCHAVCCKIIVLMIKFTMSAHVQYLSLL